MLRWGCTVESNVTTYPPGAEGKLAMVEYWLEEKRIPFGLNIFIATLYIHVAKDQA